MYLFLRNTPSACCGDSKSKATGLLLPTTNVLYSALIKTQNKFYINAYSERFLEKMDIISSTSVIFVNAL